MRKETAFPYDMRPIVLFGLLLFAVSTLEASGEEPFCETERYSQAYVTKMTCVSSRLKSGKGNSYGVGGLLDGRNETAWCEGVQGDGIGEAVTVRLEAASPLRGLTIRNGDARSMDHHQRNNRVRVLDLMLISYDEREPPRSMNVVLRDTADEQHVRLPWDVPDPRLLELTIAEVYPGTRFKDTCLTELGLDFGM